MTIRMNHVARMRVGVAILFPALTDEILAMPCGTPPTALAEVDVLRVVDTNDELPILDATETGSGPKSVLPPDSEIDPLELSLKLLFSEVSVLLFPPALPKAKREKWPPATGLAMQ